MRRKHVMAMVVAGVAAGILAVGTSLSFAGAGGGAAGGGAAACADIRQQIEAGANVNVAQAIQCDQQEFQALENERQAARAAGQNPAMQNSATCQAVNERAASGESIDFNLAFHCRQRERFANNVNAQNGNAQGKQLTSLCQGIQARLQQGEEVDAFQQAFCQQEAQAAGLELEGAQAGAGDNADEGQAADNGDAGNAGDQGQDGQAGDQGQAGDNGMGMDDAGNAGDADNVGNAGNNGNAGNGEVVCQGETVTTNGLGGAPGAASGDFPIGTELRITNLDNNKSVTVPVTAVSGSCALLNTAAFEQVREPGKFLIRNARIERVG